MSLIYTCTYFHCMLFLLFFSIRPMPSRTLVMSYILLFCLTASISAALNKNLKHACHLNIRQITNKATTVNPREYFNDHMVFLTVAIIVTNNHCFPLKSMYLLLSNPVHHLVPFAREKQTGQSTNPGTFQTYFVDCQPFWFNRCQTLNRGYLNVSNENTNQIRKRIMAKCDVTATSTNQTNASRITTADIPCMLCDPQFRRLRRQRLRRMNHQFWKRVSFYCDRETVRFGHSCIL